MTEQYMPTTEEVREGYSRNFSDPDWADDAFDRWLAEVRAEAYERAILDVGLNPDLTNQLLDTNPHRKAEE